VIFAVVFKVDDFVLSSKIILQLTLKVITLTLNNLN